MSSGRKVSAKARMLAFLQKRNGYNTFSTAQAVNYFGVSPSTVSATISALRNDGYAIYLNPRKRGDGSAVGIYRLGTPKQSVLAAR